MYPFIEILLDIEEYIPWAGGFLLLGDPSRRIPTLCQGRRGLGVRVSILTSASHTLNLFYFHRLKRSSHWYSSTFHESKHSYSIMYMHCSSEQGTLHGKPWHKTWKIDDNFYNIFTNELINWQPGGCLLVTGSSNSAACAIKPRWRLMLVRYMWL